MKWVSINNLNDNDNFGAGVAFKLLPTEKGKKAGNCIPENGLIYMLIDIPGDYMWLSCISVGEEGNIMSCLKKIKICLYQVKKLRKC